jgi:hypothetical protein
MSQEDSFIVDDLDDPDLETLEALLQAGDRDRYLDQPPNTPPAKALVEDCMRAVLPKLRREWCERQGPLCLRAAVADLLEAGRWHLLQSVRGRVAADTALHWAKTQKWRDMIRHTMNEVVVYAEVQSGPGAGASIDPNYVMEGVEKVLRCVHLEFSISSDVTDICGLLVCGRYPELFEGCWSCEVLPEGYSHIF